MISTIISTTLLQTLIPYKKTDIESKTGFEDNVYADLQELLNASQLLTGKMINLEKSGQQINSLKTRGVTVTSVN